jgi:hypothetical protein
VGSGMYRRSRIFAFIGIPVVMAAVVVVALAADPADPNPQGTLIPIFAIVGAFLAGLFTLQRRDLKSGQRAAAPDLVKVRAPVGDPTQLHGGELWAALAVAPMDEEALRAQQHGWEVADRSQSAGMVVTAIILVAVPLSYLLESFLPVLIAAPLIVAYALIKGLAGALGAGGLAGAYEQTARAIAPLGLELAERPQVGIGPRPGPEPGAKTNIRGALAYAGRRHGRAVGVRWEGGACEVRVEAAAPAFEARSSGGRIMARKEPPPPEIARVLAELPRSKAHWKNLRASGSAEGISVRRKPAGAGQEWLLDLWLAEQLATALGPPATGPTQMI